MDLLSAQPEKGLNNFQNRSFALSSHREMWSEVLALLHTSVVAPTEPLVPWINEPATRL